MEEILIPLGICVVMPVLVVWIVFHAKQNRDNRRSEVLMKAIENNSNVNIDALAESLKGGSTDPAEIQRRRFQRGAIYTLVGLSMALLSLVLMSIDSIDRNLYVIAIIMAAVFLPIGLGYLAAYFTIRKNEAAASRNQED